MRTLFAIACYFLSLSTAFAFTPDECSALLRFGIYDEHTVVENKLKFSSIKQSYCESDEGGGSFSIPVADIPVAGGANFKSAMCSDTASTELQTYFFYRYGRTINEAIVKGFDECLKTSNIGVAFVVYTDEDPERFSVKFTFGPANAVPSDVVTALVEGATCRSPALDGPTTEGQRFKFEIGPAGFELSCKREPDSTVVLTASAERLGVTTRSIKLPPFQPASAPTQFQFNGPLVHADDAPNPKSYPLDMCAGFATSCEKDGIRGLAASTLWCHSVGLGKAVDAEVIDDSPPTMVLQGKILCARPGCDMVSSLVCSR